MSLLRRHTNAFLSTVLQPLTSIIDPLLTKYPFWSLAFHEAVGLYGYYIALKQEEINEIIIFISEHPNEFRQEIVESKEFRNGFVQLLEEYLKQRISKKKKVLKSLLLGFTTTQNKEYYELERLNDCLVRMSIEGLNFLIFLKTKIIPILDYEIEQELINDRYKNSDRSLEWWHNELLLQKSVWLPIEKWLHDNYSPNTDKVKKDYNQEIKAGWLPDLLHRAMTREKEESRIKHEAMIELVSLGILRSLATGGSIGNGTANDYRLTQFGITFIKLVE